MISGFLLGIIAASSFTAGVFFLKFWRQTRDSLFLGFAAFFIIEGFNRCALLFVLHPNEGSPGIYLLRLFALLLLLTAILKKNYGKEYMGVVRSAFLVGPDGKVTHAWPKISPKDTPTNLLAALADS